MTNDDSAIKIGKVRRIIGDILLVLMLLLSVEIIIDMFSKMFLESTEGDVQKAMVFELLICWVLFLTVFDIRFSIFTCEGTLYTSGCDLLLVNSPSEKCSESFACLLIST